MNRTKQKLHTCCEDFVKQRIESFEHAIKRAKESAQGDTKSSAGDKYETSREMLQQEINQNNTQLLEAMKLKHLLTTIDIQKVFDRIQTGSLVVTNQGNFYISISAGNFRIGKKDYIAVSTTSPIGLKLMNLKVGDRFSFNETIYLIEEIH